MVLKAAQKQQWNDDAGEIRVFEIPPQVVGDFPDEVGKGGAIAGSYFLH